MLAPELDTCLTHHFTVRLPRVPRFDADKST
jgi:hypothetical protein